MSSDDATSDTNDNPGGLPIPKTWFAKLKELSSTKYYKEVLKECGTFRTWSGK